MIPIISNYSPHLGLLSIALMLGMRHGIDLDHLAMIDSMTRRLSIYSKLSQWVGFWFSLGHGIVVILFSTLLTVFVKNFTMPDWAYTLMTGLSISLLIFFGWINIYSFIKTSKVSSELIYQRKIFKIFQVVNINPLNIMAIGAVFAISFDTMSQVTLISMNAIGLFNILFSVLMGVAFMLGMMFTDGINGYVISCLIRKTSRLSFTLSRMLTFSVGLFSTTIGICEIAQLL